MALEKDCRQSLRLTVYGRVQGVFFRVSAREMAKTLGLVGYVKNMPDGTVEILAEGSKDKLTKFKNWCKNGPLHANVERVDGVIGDVKQRSFGDFDIIA